MSISDFNFKWFTTVPGLLITGGVVLLILALISLILSGKKSKKEKKAKAEANAVNQQPNMAVPGQPVPESNSGVQPVSNVGDPLNGIATPVANPAAPVADPMMGMGGAAPADPAFAAFNVAPQPVQPQVAPDPMMMPQQPVGGMAPDPMMMQPQMAPQMGVPEIPSMNAMPAAGGDPMIYGGANPAAPVASAPVAGAPVMPQAYGGVDPMAGTQMMPGQQVVDPNAGVMPGAMPNATPGVFPNQQ